MVELVDATDLKSVGQYVRVGSSPIPGTIIGPIAQLVRASDS